jgi:class 3 adenylate cyclase/tetratricopeptide (TPR) repeat protein
VQCPQCRQQNPAAQNFCGECGARLHGICPACQTTNPPGQKFCGECGQRLTAASPLPKSPPSVPTPESYTPQHLAERILTSRAALEGERKQVTVLFADLKGSMELLADRDPEEARAILDPVLERMVEAVHRYEGTVNQVLGDGIMALFGAPLAHEDHAVRACYAALRMQESVREYAEEVRRTEGLVIQIRVGLNSGEVVVRSIGSDLRMDYTAVGQTTHLAARMEQLAAPGSSLLAPDTLRLAEGYIQVKPLGPTAVKGLSAPVEVYELVGAGMARSRLQATAARGLTKFVGRDSELETLRRTLELAGNGHGQVVALVGEPGVGKSRLVWEFSHSHRTQGWLVLESRSVSYGKASPYLPVIDLLKSYCGIEAQDDVRRVREKVLGKLLGLDETLRLTLPALLSLLDIPVDDPAWEALDPPQRRQRTLEALKRLLLRESQEQPLLLVFEDLHWIDTETQALLDGLVESLPTARLLLLVNYRPEYAHAWGNRTYYSQLRLDPLPIGSAQELLGALLGEDVRLAPLMRLLTERTEGNPFFLEESVRTLVETGVLVGERGSYRLGKPLASIQVPATVQAVLAARIDRLTPEDKRLLQCAAVIGKDVPYPILRAIAELREEWLRQGLADLQAAELLYETNLFPDPDYTFKHALTHEVAYASLLQERRRALHARIVAAIEALYPDRLGEYADELAQHAVRGEQWAKAVAYLRQAGTRAAARSAHREAASYFEQAMAALDHLPESRATCEQAIDLRFELRSVLLPLGEQRRIITLLHEAEPLARALQDRRRLGWVAVYLGSYEWQAGAAMRAIELGRGAVAHAEALGDHDLAVAANWALAPAYSMLGDYHQAAALYRRNVDLIGEAQMHDSFGLPFLPAVQARTMLAAYCLAELGEFAEGIALGQEGMRVAEAADHPFSIAGSYGQLAHLHVIQGRFDQAIPLFERVLAYLDDHPMAPFGATIRAELAYAYASSRPGAPVAGLLEQVTFSPINLNSRLSGLISVGQARALIGEFAAASACAAEVLVDARAHGLHGHEAWALRLHGEIAAQADPPEVEQAETHYRQALALAEELSMRPLAAHCHLGLGTLYQKIGRDEQAQAELSTAAEMYRAMEMPFWLAKAEALSVPAAD